MFNSDYKKVAMITIREEKKAQSRQNFKNFITAKTKKPRRKGKKK